MSTDREPTIPGKPKTDQESGLKHTLAMAKDIIRALLVERARFKGYINFGSALEVLSSADIRGTILQFKAIEARQHTEVFQRAKTRNQSAGILTLTRQDLTELSDVEVAELVRAFRCGVAK